MKLIYFHPTLYLYRKTVRDFDAVPLRTIYDKGQLIHDLQVLMKSRHMRLRIGRTLE